MAKRRRSMGSSPCLDKQSKQIGKQQYDSYKLHEADNKADTRETTQNSENAIILRHWYRYGFDIGQPVTDEE